MQHSDGDDGRYGAPEAASRAAIGGHPLHPMLVPLPIGLLMAALASDIASVTTADPFWARAAAWLIGAGLVTGVAAGAVGAIDFASIRRARRTAWGWVHAVGNVAALLIAGVSLSLRGAPVVGTTELVLSLVTVAVLGATGWAGGELSYRHGVGLAPRPASGRVI